MPNPQPQKKTNLASNEQTQECWEWDWCSQQEETGGSEGRGELGKGEASSGCGQEAGEEGGEAWDVPPNLGGRGVGDDLQLSCYEGVGQWM